MKKYWKLYRVMVMITIVSLIGTLLYALVILLIYGPIVLPDWTGKAVIGPILILAVMAIPFPIQHHKEVIDAIKEFISFK